MTRRIVDLSTPIRTGHFRWQVDRQNIKTHGKDGSYVQASWMGWPIHGFTHMDAARHFDPDGATTGEVPMADCMGSAVVLDLRHAKADAPITRDHVARAGEELKAGDIALLCTGWDRRASIDEPAFWSTAPWMSAEACRWLLGRGIRAIGYDFPQDRCIRDFVSGDRMPAREENTTHMELLLKGVTMFEYLCNLGDLTRARVEFIALPLKIPDCDGAPVRAVAIEE